MAVLATAIAISVVVVIVAVVAVFVLVWFLETNAFLLRMPVLVFVLVLNLCRYWLSFETFILYAYSLGRVTRTHNPWKSSGINTD